MQNQALEQGSNSDKNNFFETKTSKNMPMKTPGNIVIRAIDLVSEPKPNRPLSVSSTPHPSNDPLSFE
jgi:hypothetical protein